MGKSASIYELLGGKVTGPDYETNARRLFGLRVRIASIASSDPDEISLVGLTGRLTAPFANYDGLLGLRIDAGQAYNVDWQEEPLVTPGEHTMHEMTMGLLANDAVEVLDDPVTS